MAGFHTLELCGTLTLSGYKMLTCGSEEDVRKDTVRPLGVGLESDGDKRNIQSQSNNAPSTRRDAGRLLFIDFFFFFFIEMQSKKAKASRL